MFYLPTRNVIPVWIIYNLSQPATLRKSDVVTTLDFRTQLIFICFQDGLNSLVLDLDYPALRKNKNIDNFLNRCKLKVALKQWQCGGCNLRSWVIRNASLVFILLFFTPLTSCIQKALKDHLLQRCFIWRSYIVENVLDNIDCRM